jgi:ABC-type amino acid transport substrate-binding protein
MKRNVALLVTLLLVFISCSVMGDDWKSVLETGVIRIGEVPPYYYPNFTLPDGKPGFSLEYIREIIPSDWRIELVETTWGYMGPGIENNEFDVMIDPIFPREHLLGIAEILPYSVFDTVVAIFRPATGVVFKSSPFPDIIDVSSLIQADIYGRGIVMGAPEDFASDLWLQANMGTHISLPDPQTTFEWLENGDIDIAFMDERSAILAMESLGLAGKFDMRFVVEVAEAGFLVNQRDTALIEMLREGIQMLDDNGTTRSLAEKHDVPEVLRYLQ